MAFTGSYAASTSRPPEPSTLGAMPHEDVDEPWAGPYDPGVQERYASQALTLASRAADETMAAAARRATAVLRDAEQRAQLIVEQAEHRASTIVAEARATVRAAFSARRDEVIAALAQSHDEILGLLERARRDLQALAEEAELGPHASRGPAGLDQRVTSFQRSTRRAAERAATERLEAQTAALRRRAVQGLASSNARSSSK